PEGVKQLTDVIERMVAVLGEGVGRLKKGDDVMRYCIEAKSLEEEGDAIYHDSLGRLFEKERDAIELIKWKEIYDNLEMTLDQSEVVVDLLPRSEEHTSELQSRVDLVCRLLLEKKKHKSMSHYYS